MIEKRIFVNSVEIQTREYESEGQAIVFLHFSGANLVMWLPVVPFFQSRYHLVLVDLRGHGKSSQPDDGYQMDEMAEDIIGVMRTLKIEKAHVVGSSLGAEVGLSMAANHPDKILSLVCDGVYYSEYGPFGVWPGTEQEFTDYVASRLEKMRSTHEPLFDTLEDLIEDRRHAYTEFGVWNKHVEAMVRYGVRIVEGGKIRKSWGKKASENYASHYFFSRFEEYYRRVKCPILILPDEDVLNCEREKNALYGLQRLAKNCQIARVDGWSHPYGWMLTPKEVSQVVLNFINLID